MQQRHTTYTQRRKIKSMTKKTWCQIDMACS